MEFRILGPLEVREQGELLELRAGKERTVLAMLLLSPGSVVSVDHLIEALWNGAAPASAVNSVHVYVSKLRKLLGPRLLTRAHGYALEIESSELDVQCFEQDLADGRRKLASGDARGAAEALRNAMTMWRGPPLVEFTYEAFAQEPIRRLEELRLSGEEERIEAELACGKQAELVVELRRLVAEHPLRERFTAQLMVALYRAGRQAEALEVYAAARESFVEELGLEPARSLRELQGAILDQDPGLDLVASPPAVENRRPPPSRRGLRLLAAGGVLVVGVVLAVAQLSGPGHLERVDANAIALIDGGENAIVGQVTLVERPEAIAAGGGYIWAASERDGIVTRIDPDSRSVRSLDIQARPAAVAFGGGSLWVADAAAGSVTQIDPRTFRVARRYEVGSAPVAVAVGEGAVWVANGFDGTVSRIDLDGGRTKTIPVGASPAGLAVGLGAAWVTTEADGRLIRIAARTASVTGSVNVGNGPSGVATADGSVWVANRQDDTVSRVDPGSGSVAATIPVGRGPGAVSAGLGAVWVANGGEGSVSRIDARAGVVAETIPVRSSPDELAVADGKLWATTAPLASGHRGGVLRAEVGQSGCVCVDPAFAQGGPSAPAVSLAYDGLVAYRRVGGVAGARLLGNLAQRVPAPTDRGLTYVFRLRDGVRYSDGTAVQPADVRYSLERSLRINPDAASLLGGIVGADGCGKPKEPCDLAAGIDVDAADRTVTIHLRAPDPNFVHKLSHPWAYVLPTGTALREVRAATVPGTGPYRIAEVSHDQSVRLVRNSRFRVWSRDARPDGFADEIRLEAGRSPGASIAAVEKGRADWVSIYPIEPRRAAVSRLLTRHAGLLHAERSLFTEWMFLNTREPPFDDLRVRRALNFAVDRGAIADLLGGSQVAEPTCQILPPGLPGYRPYCPYTRAPSPAQLWSEPDLQTAHRLIAASGTEGMRVVVHGREDRPQYGRYVAGLLRRLGYRASLRLHPIFVPGQPERSYFGHIANSRNRVQIASTNWIPVYPSPADYIAPTFSCAAFRPNDPVANANLSRFCDRTVDADMRRAAALAVSDPARSAALWERADRALTDRAAAVPLVNPRSIDFVSARVGNYQFHPQWGALLDQLWVE